MQAYNREIFSSLCGNKTRPQGYKTFFILSSAEIKITGFGDLHEITIIRAISSFRSILNFVLSGVEPEKSFILYPRGPGPEVCSLPYHYDSFIYLRPSQGFWGFREKGYLFSGIWGEGSFIFRDLGRKHNFLGF